MFYELSKNNKEKKDTNNKISNQKKYFWYGNIKQIEEIYERFNLDYKIINDSLNTNNLLQPTIYMYQNYFFGILIIKSMDDINKIIGKIGIILKDNILFFINIDNNDKINKILENVNSNLENMNGFEDILNFLLNKIIDNSFSNLEYIENKIVNIEKQLFEKEISNNLNPLIFKIKKELLYYKRYYGYLINFCSDINNENNHLDTNKFIGKLNRLNIYTDDLIQNTIHLSEIYQSYLDFYQNRVIKILTVLTAIFLPLTVITSWYGMNLKYIPEINYKYSYPIIIAVCLIIISICLWIFKKKKII